VDYIARGGRRSPDGGPGSSRSGSSTGCRWMRTWSSICATCPILTSFPELRLKTGLDSEVAAFVLETPEGEELLTDLSALLYKLLPRYEREGKSYLTIAVGCTGGRQPLGGSRRGVGGSRCGALVTCASSIATPAMGQSVIAIRQAKTDHMVSLALWQAGLRARGFPLRCVSSLGEAIGACCPVKRRRGSKLVITCVAHRAIPTYYFRHLAPPAVASSRIRVQRSRGIGIGSGGGSPKNVSHCQPTWAARFALPVHSRSWPPASPRRSRSKKDGQTSTLVERDSNCCCCAGQPGSEITVVASGTDAEQAVLAIGELVLRTVFGEAS